MTWFIVYETASGRRISETSEEPSRLPAGMDYNTYAAPDDALMWDDATADLIPRPPPVIVDRALVVIDDFEVRGGTVLTARQRNDLRLAMEAEYSAEELTR